MKNEYKSRVYTDRPAYADFDAPAKFTAIQSIIAKRLKQYPKAICSYSGGSDSDILIARFNEWEIRGARMNYRQIYALLHCGVGRL